MIRTCTKKLLILSIFLLGSFTFQLYAQKNFTGFAEPSVSLNIKPESPWSYNFTLANRDVLYKNEEFNAEVKHIELAQYTSLNVGLYGKITAGIRYRFIEMFDDYKDNEVRLVEQYSYSTKIKNFKASHRFRIAQRFRERTTHRFRYRFLVDIPLNGQRSDVKEFSLSLSTESVLEMGKEEKPSLGQRLNSSLSYQLSSDAKFKFGIEYRYRNYTQTPRTELFLLTGLSLSL